SMVLLLRLASVAADEPEKGFSSPAAAQHYERATRYYEQRDYERTIAEALAGQAIELRPQLFYLLGQAERMRGNCRKAIEYYHAARALAPSPAQSGALRIQIERCHSELGRSPEPAPPTPVPAAPPEAQSEPSAPQPAPVARPATTPATEV